MTVPAHAPSETLSLLPPQIEQLVEAQRRFFDSGVTRPYVFRKAQLGGLRAAVKRYENRLLEALYTDLHRDAFEAFGTELGPFYTEVKHTLSHLQQWMQPEAVPTPIMFFPSRSYTVRQPLGLTLHISPWNYPFLLLMGSVIGAIAGGNTLILKPSELAPATTQVVVQMIEETFEPVYIAIITGPGHLVTSQLIEQYHFDHIFYTGSTTVGKIIMQAAARHLSPVTLELGGKSPTVVTQHANLRFAAKRIAWGKLMNAGQACVSNDYVLVHASVKDKFIPLLKEAFTQMTGPNPQQSPHYARIINQRQYQRLCGYLQQGQILHGGQTDANDLYIAPTIMDGVSLDAPLMQEEIFGPIMPLFSYTTNEEAIDVIKRNDYPLALYVYSDKKATADYFLQRVRFGGGCVNNGFIHLANPHLGFGGVGYSGIGAYHGKDSFDTFTHKQSIMRSPSWWDLPLWYSPRKAWYLKVLKRLMG